MLVHCKQTLKITAVPNWKALDHCRGVCSLTSPAKVSVEVLFQPREAIQLKAAVGPCYPAKAGAQKQVLTLGLILDEFENATLKNYWAVGVSHGFLPYVIFRLYHSSDDAEAEKVALVCPSIETNHCESCTSNHFLQQCVAKFGAANMRY